MHIEKDRKTGNYGNCPKCIHIKYSSYPQVIHIGWITYVNHVYSRCKDVCKRIWESAVFYRAVLSVGTAGAGDTCFSDKLKKIRKKRRFYLT